MKGNEGKKESVKSAQGFQIPIPSIHQNLWTVRPAVRNSVRKSVRPSVSIRVRAPKSRNIPWVGQQRQRWGHIKAKLDLNVRRGRHWPANGQTLKSFIPPPASPSLKILGYLATAGAYWIGKLNGYNHSIASYKCIITPRNGKVGVPSRAIWIWPISIPNRIRCHISCHPERVNTKAETCALGQVSGSHQGESCRLSKVFVSILFLILIPFPSNDSFSGG